MKYLENIKEVYGPYTRASDGRQIVVLYYLDGTKTSRSYPKYLKEMELGRELNPNTETIDHIDRDHTNSLSTNIQILTRSENASKSVKRRKAIFSECPWCGIIFELTRAQISNRQCGKTKAPPYCTRSCSGKYNREIQLGRRDPLPDFDLNVEYYRLDDAPT